MKKSSKQPKKQNIGEKNNKKQYKVRNWREYNQTLVDRGTMELWVSKEALQAWEERFKAGKHKCGKPRIYSNVAIETALVIQQVFHLTLRQTEGFLTSILKRIGRKHWKQEINYHRRSLAETTMFRLKTICADKVQARTEANQRVQLLLRCKALYYMTMLGMPDSYVVV